MTSIQNLQRRALDWVVRHHPALGLDKRSEYFVRLFEPYLPPQAEVLDIGGGWGFYGEPIEDRGHRLTVLDVVKPGFQKTPVVLYDGKRFPFSDKSFDVSLLVTMLHHVPDPGAVLAEAKRVTRSTLIVVEDLFRHALGRLWTQWRDKLYNFEFFGHPCQFKKREDWLALFAKSYLPVADEKQVYTWLSGLRILNGVFILKADG